MSNLFQKSRVARMAACGLCRGVFLCTVLLCLVSCIWEFPPEETDALSLGDGATLALKVSLFDTDGFAAADREGEGLPEVEKMHDLRVVITSKADDGSEQVEFNRYLDFRSGDWMYKYGYLDDDRLVFKVSGTNPQKHVYLFANCEPLFEDIFKENAEKGDGVTVHVDPENGLYGDIGANEDWKPLPGEDYIKMLHEATYTNGQLQKWVKTDGGKANGIPMSAEYEISVSPGNTGISGVHVLEAYILRAANKITFTYENTWIDQDLYIHGFSIDKVAKEAYLLARVPLNEHNRRLLGDDTKNGTWLEWYVAHIAGILPGGHPDSSSPDELQFVTPGQDIDEKEYADGQYSRGPLHSETDPYDPLPTEEWQNFYDNIYGKKSDGRYMYTTEENENIKGFYLKSLHLQGKPDRRTTETVYFPESNYHPVNRDGGSSANQQYNLHIYATSREETYNTVHVYNVVLTNVTTLFRNTHVHITARPVNEEFLIWGTLVDWNKYDEVSGEMKPENDTGTVSDTPPFEAEP